MGCVNRVVADFDPSIAIASLVSLVSGGRGAHVDIDNLNPCPRTAHPTNSEVFYVELRVILE